MRSPYFLYPDESTVKGSTVAAAALLHACLTKEVRERERERASDGIDL